MKRILSAFLALLFCFSFSGCLFDEYSSSERSKLIKTGEKIFMDHLAKKDPKAKITGMGEINYLGKNHQFQLTEFAKGTYRSGGEEFKFAVNTRTGAVYTSKQQKEFREKMASHINRLLNLQWTAVKEDVYPSSIVPFTPTDPKRPPMSDEPIILQGLLPAGITDMDAYVKTALENPSLQLSLRFLFTGRPLHPDTIPFAAADTFANHTHMELQRYPDSLKAVLETENRTAYGANPKWPVNNHACLAEETVTFNKTGEKEERRTFRKWNDYKGAGPFTVHYAAYTRTTERQKDGSVKNREERFDAEKELTVVKQGTQYEFKTKDGKPLAFYLFIDSLAAVDNVNEIAERNRKFHDAAFNESRWRPVLDRWAAGAKGNTVNQIYLMQQNDLIITGKEALRKLGKKN